MKRSISLIFTVLLCVFTASCGNNLNNDVMLKYGSHAVDKGTYMYLAATYKAAFLDSYNGGFDTEEFFDSELEKDGRTMTYENYIAEYIQNEISRTLISFKQFEDLKLELAEKDLENINTELSDLLAAESEDEINAALAPYGIDFAKLRDIKLMQLKSETAFSYLYEENGKNAPSTKEFQDYLNKNYRAIGIISVMTEEKYLLDEDGNNVFDDEGNAKTVPLSEKEKEEKLTFIEKVLSELKAGADFSECAKYSDIDYTSEYPLGIMISSNEVNAYGKDIVTTALSMKAGDFKRLDGKDKTYILVCFEMPDAGTLGENYDISEMLYNCTMARYMEDTEKILKDEIQVNTDEISKIDLKKLKKNTFY